MKLARLLAFVLLIAGAAVQPASAVEHILHFLSDVTVERDGDLDVTETIKVKVEQYGTIKHGILRDFPTTYTRPDGSRVVVGFAVQSVTLDGAKEPWSTEGMTNGVRVRIGSAATTLSAGEHEFVIRYHTNRQIAFLPDYDELYWNATGNGWTFAIDVAEARITLPDAVPFKADVGLHRPPGLDRQRRRDRRASAGRHHVSDDPRLAAEEWPYCRRVLAEGRGDGADLEPGSPVVAHR